MTRFHYLPLLAFFPLAGCTVTDKHSVTCEWPREAAFPLDPGTPSGLQHLADDALAAEDLAIRYADSFQPTQGRPGRIQEYARTRGQCMAKLFDAIGKNHGVPVEQIRQSLGRRRTSVDLAVILSFAALFGYGASLAARQICRRYPLKDGWVGPLGITMFVSVAGSACGVLLGEMWSLALETLRVGNSHLSHRVERIPWNQHRLGLFAGGVILVWLIVGFHYRARVRGTP